MKKLSLVKDDGEIRDHRLNDGRSITIDVSDDSELVMKDDKNNEIGKSIYHLKVKKFPGDSF